MMLRRWCGGSILLAAALMLAAAPAEAQLVDRGIQITVWGGPYGTLGNLGNEVRTGARGGGVPISETKMHDGVGFGGSVEVPIPIERLSVRGDFGFVPSATMETVSFFPCPLPQRETSKPEHCRALSDGTLFTGVADLVYRTEQDYTRPHGIFMIGFGLKNYSFDGPITMRALPNEPPTGTITGDCPVGDAVCSWHKDFTGSTTDPTLHVGFGLSGSLGGVNFIGEVADYVSIYSHESNGRVLEEMVHDLFLKLSAGIRVF